MSVLAATKGFSAALQRTKVLTEFARYVASPLTNRLFPRFPHVEAERILAIACTGHGASLAYVDRAGNVRSSQLERWTGVKHMMMFSADELADLQEPKNDVDRGIRYVFCHGYGRFPDNCVFETAIIPWFSWLVGDLDVRPEDIDLLVTSNGHFATGWARLGPHLRQWFPNATVVRKLEHHEIHQRQAFWASGFCEAAVLTLDTCGEPLPRLRGKRVAGTIALMDQTGAVQRVREFLFPEMSSGTIFDATTHHVGFRQGQEGKTMGLAAFGEPELYEEIRPHLHLEEDGAFSFLSQPEFQAVLDQYVPARDPGAALEQRHSNVAYAGQAILEDIVANAWQAALTLTGQRGLVYAGGVALNSVANGKAARFAQPEALYIPPNPGDPGHALGCALFGAYEIARWDPPSLEVPEYLGPPYSAAQLAETISGNGYPTARPENLEEQAAVCIANGHIVARYDGRAEFGPRALGNRSIVCDPRRPNMKDYLNLRVKHREPFRPFAPSVMEEHVSEWFELDERSPYMLRVVPIRSEKLERIPAVAHVDGTARLQTVSQQENEGYWRLIEAFYRRTGVALVLNTSFNIAGKPIVESPADALTCFVETEIDVLLIGPFVVSKAPLETYLESESEA